MVHGRWIKPVPGDGEAYCSNCKNDALPCGYYMNPALMRYYETAYCPYCGAEMDGEQRLAFADQSGAEYADNPTV